MKNLLFTIMAVVSATAAFAQQTPASADSKATQVTSTNITHCYAMKNGAMIECFGNKETPMTASVTLSNGIKVTYTGQIVALDGTEILFGEGKCIDLNGKVSDYSSVHSDHK